jgi:trk system potassium uptake protein TrkH
MMTIDIRSRLDEISARPARFLAIGFFLLILVGATLLNLPIASINGNSVGFIDALFTSASAVCVTGLIVVNTAAHWTFFGKLIILVLIQIGGLGFMTMATLVALVLGRKITLKNRLILQEELNNLTLSGVVKLTKYVLYSTFFIEAVGALILSFRFVPDFGFWKGIWFAIFHSISAFCNAGFDLIGNSMESYAGSFLVIMTMSILVVIGGIGFSVFINLFQNIRMKKPMSRLSIHTKLTLVITSGLLVVGFIFIYLVEFTNPETLGAMTGTEKILSAFFQSVVPRTAGFNSVPMGSLRDASTFLIIMLMFIGGSPGSTAGGIKTTTIGVVFLTILSNIKGKEDVELYKKRIPKRAINKAITIFTLGLAVCLVSTLLLAITEHADFLDILFETVSAYATVGLSRGITADLTVFGRLLIVGNMFFGRLGPLTIAFALAEQTKKSKGIYRFAEENINVG